MKRHQPKSREGTTGRNGRAVGLKDLAAAAAIIILILHVEKRRDPSRTASEGQLQSPLLQITTSILKNTMGVRKCTLNKRV